MTSRKLPRLAWEVDLLWDYLGYNVGFKLRPRRTVKNFLVPSTRTVGVDWLHRHHSRDNLRHTFEVYDKLRVQMERATWAPYHFVERYGELTRRLDALLEAQYKALRLSEPERVALEAKIPYPAEQLQTAVKELQKALLEEAELEQSTDTYGELQRRFERHRDEQVQADQNWRAIKSEYDEYMGSTRVNELEI